MLNIALFGPPGAGKGTQSTRLMEQYNLTYISTGDILREEIANGTSIGLKAKVIIDKGGLAPDELIVQIIEKKIKENPNSNGFLFDGFPRTVVQAYILEGLLYKMHTSLTCMLSLEVPREELLKRLKERSKSSGRVDDQDMEVIQFRLTEYDNKTAPVADFYQALNKYYPINGFGSLTDIYERLVDAITSSLKKEWINIVLLGPPGAGKGTQAAMLAKKYNLVHMATGEMLRDEVMKNTDIGRKAFPYMERGDIVPDELVIRLMERRIDASPNASGFLFDGFPMDMVQAYILDGLLRKHHSSITTVLYLKASTLQSIKRLIERGKTEEARSYDASADIIIRRLEQYHETSSYLNEFYGATNKCSVIDGDGTKEEVFANLSEKIDKVLHLTGIKNIS